MAVPEKRTRFGMIWMASARYPSYFQFLHDFKHNHIRFHLDSELPPPPCCFFFWWGGGVSSTNSYPHYFTSQGKLFDLLYCYPTGLILGFICVQMFPILLPPDTKILHRNFLCFTPQEKWGHSRVLTSSLTPVAR